MRTARFLSLMFVITTFSLFYVYQQSEVFRLAYAGQKKQALFQDLLDKNSILRYNIGRNGSLTQIGSRISSCADFQMPDTYRLVRLAPSSEGLNLRIQPPGKKETIILRLFGIKRQAEAKTVNP